MSRGIPLGQGVVQRPLHFLLEMSVEYSGAPSISVFSRVG